MTKIPVSIRAGAHNRAGAPAVANGLKTARTAPPAGWPPPDRAPRLRRTADLIEEHAELSVNPARARRLARDMRTRATEIELHGYSSDELSDVMRDLGADRPSNVLLA